MGPEGPTNTPPTKIERIFPRIFSINFNENSIEGEKTPVGTTKLVDALNTWWENLCKEQGFNGEDKKFKNIDYYIIELGKNALEHGGSGEVKVVFDREEITVVVNDNGPGLELPNEAIESMPNHGLSSVKDYADEFMIEANGKKFVKVRQKRELKTSLETDKKTGTRITFIKKIQVA